MELEKAELELARDKSSRYKEEAAAVEHLMGNVTRLS